MKGRSKRCDNRLRNLIDLLVALIFGLRNELIRLQRLCALYCHTVCACDRFSWACGPLSSLADGVEIWGFGASVLIMPTQPHAAPVLSTGQTTESVAAPYDLSQSHSHNWTKPQTRNTTRSYNKALIPTSLCHWLPRQSILREAAYMTQAAAGVVGHLSYIKNPRNMIRRPEIIAVFDIYG